MGNGTIELDTTAMFTGGDLSHYAGQAAARAARRLAQSTLPEGIFGDFDVARAYHGTVTAAHSTHVDRLHGHRDSLTGISGKATTGARAFEATDDNAAGLIAAVGNDLGTLAA